MPANFTRWTHQTSTSDEGEYGLMPAINGTRDDGKTFHIHAYENGDGGLVLHLHATYGVRVEIVEDDETEGEIVYAKYPE